MSASPPMILSVTVCWVNVGVDSVHVSPTSKNPAEGAVASRLYVSPLPTISMNGNRCSTGESLMIVSTTPVRSTSLDSLAASARVRAMGQPPSASGQGTVHSAQKEEA